MVEDKCQRAFNQLLKVCAIDVSLKGSKKSVPKKDRAKRPMSGYNCFTKTLYAAEKKTAKKEKRAPMAYSQLLKMKTWGTLEDKQKVHWKGLADMGCPQDKIVE